MSKIRLAAALLAVSTVALADPAVLDNESDVKAALAAPFYVAETTSGPAEVLVGRARGVTRHALAVLHASTTPAALAAVPAGVDFTCPQGGTMTARLSPTRVLTLEFVACVYTFQGPTWELTGAAEVRLSSPTFTPQSVAVIRLGTSGADLVQRLVYDGVPDPTYIERHNSRVAGRIVIAGSGETAFYGPFEYRLTGFMSDDNGTSRRLYFAEDLRMSGELAYQQFGDLEWYETRYHYDGGTVGNRVTEIEPGTDTSWTSTVGDLRTRFVMVHRPSNGDTVTSLDVDGDIDITAPNEEWNAGCVNGEYRFHTVRPLLVARANTSPMEVVDGDLRINDTVTAVFTALPRPTTHVLARGIGSFRYHDNVRAIAASANCGW